MTPSRLAAAHDRAATVAMLSRAFANDPAMAWIFPDPIARARRMPRLFALLYDSDQQAGMQVLTPDGEAATLWRGPGRVQTPRAEMIRKAIPIVHAFGPALRRAIRLADAVDAHMPVGDFWYLHIAGCDPVHQGRGLGAAAVRAGLERAAGRTRCYLETATEHNLGFYRGLGFSVTAEWRVPGDGPRFWSMLRPAD